MDNIEEFEFWCAEYRDNPNMAATEIDRLLQDMCSRGNPFAQAYSQQLLTPESTTDIGQISFANLSELRQSEQIGLAPSSIDDLDGIEWPLVVSCGK